MESVDLVVMVVDPAHEAILLADRARVLTAEAGKDFVVQAGLYLLRLRVFTEVVGMEAQKEA